MCHGLKKKQILVIAAMFCLNLLFVKKLQECTYKSQKFTSQIYARRQLALFALHIKNVVSLKKIKLLFSQLSTF